MHLNLDRPTLDIMLEGCQIIAPDWRYVYVNPAAARQGRRNAEDLVGRTMMEAYPGIDTGPLFDALRRCMHERVPLELENEFQNPDGTLGWFQLSIQPHPEGIFILSIDVSDRVRNERLASRKQRLESLGTLVGGVAHDLNNAIAPILLGVELLRSDHPEAEEHAAMFEASAQRATEMVRQLLTFVRGGDGRRVAVHPADVVRELERLLATFPDDVSVSCTCAPDLPPLHADPTQLHQVLLNLCVNARDAMPSGGTLRLDCSRITVDETFASAVLGATPGEFVQFRVQDSGAGIERSVLDRIFEPFFTTKPVGKGTGLGLSTSLGLVQGHGGFVHVYSEPGVGTTFKVFFPLGDAPAARDPGAADFRGRGETILVADDDERMGRAARLALEELGFTVLVAADGDDALALLHAHGDQVAAILLDLHMPRLDGLRFLASLPKLTKPLPLVIASGGFDDRTLSRLDALRLHRRIDKPFTRAALAEVMRGIFRY